jgi:two-component system, NarL family, sensor histidine kinase LiaS
MSIFRKLRWKLILNYTLVTVSAFLIVILILGAIVLPRFFAAARYVTPEGLIDALKRETSPLLRHILSQSPIDTELINLLVRESDPQITSFSLLRIGSLDFSVRTIPELDSFLIGADGRLLITSQYSYPSKFIVGQSFDPSLIEGLEAPYNAARAGVTDSRRLYTVYKTGDRFVLAVPILDNNEVANPQVLGVMVLIVDSLPTQADVPSHILNIAGRSLLVFLVAIGIMGTLFGAIFAHGLTTRFNRISTTIDAWSEGNFSIFINDTVGDEISQLALRLNNMAKQLQDLLRRKQDMAVSEERNRLARDLHDSAKQQALAASFQLGTALTLFERDPQTAKKHLVEADTLVDSVRNELTDLVRELRPLAIDEENFTDVLKEYVLDWSQRCGVEANITIKGDDRSSLETRAALYRIAQEALANVARHSSANSLELSLIFDLNTVTMTIKDNGSGFDIVAPHGGLGLSFMRERAEARGGSFTIESAPGQGTRIIVILPIAQ